MREILIVTPDVAPTITDHSFVVKAPLDAIMRLERSSHVRTVVLAGTYAHDSKLAASLREMYPSIRIEREP